MRTIAITTLLVISDHIASAGDRFAAVLNSAQVVNNESHSVATGMAQFELNETGDQLSYSLQLFGLNLEPLDAGRTDPQDVVGIHMHLHVADVIGPHILNIFGTPSEDDADLVVDFENNSLSGVFDISDATRDPVTGEILEQFFPLTTKILDDWLEELAAGELYLAVHSRERATNAAPGVDIRGNIYLVPEPTTLCLLLGGLLTLTTRRTRI